MAGTDGDYLRTNRSLNCECCENEASEAVCHANSL
jgi:hypothetical protein